MRSEFKFLNNNEVELTLRDDGRSLPDVVSAPVYKSVVSVIRNLTIFVCPF